jgi:hypothetical protein
MKSSTRKRGGHVVSLYNAAASSLLPIGLTLAQQHYKRKQSRKSKKFFKRRNFKSRRV